MTRHRAASISTILTITIALGVGRPVAAQESAANAPSDPAPAAQDADAQRPAEPQPAQEAATKDKRPTAASPDAAVESSNGLARALYPILPREGNIAFSPYNIAATLELLGRGARGATAEDIQRTLGLAGDPAAGSEAYEQLWTALETATRGGPGFTAVLREKSVVVSSVVPNSPAARAPLRPGDEILAVDGRAVTSPAEIDRALKAAPEGVVLRVKSTEDEVDVRLTTVAPPTLLSAYGLWVQEGSKVDPEFAHLVKYRPASTLALVDFNAPSTRDEINAWIAEATRRKIPALFSELPRDAQFVLAGALYFKGDWASPFDAKLTRQAPFHVDATTTVEAAMMRAPRLDARVVEFPAGDAVVIELPYAGGSLVMDLIAPRGEKGLKTLEPALSPKSLTELQRGLSETSVQKVDLTMPRFKASTRLDLTSTLTALGMGSAFGGSADFTGIVADGPTRISEIVHQTVVEVNETGTEAAAATGAVGVRFAPRVTRITIDRPFLYLVRDTATGAVLFLGRISNPSETN